MPTARLRVLVIAPMRFPIRTPHAGGLEAAVWSEARALAERGHEVTLIGVRGSDFTPAGTVFELPPLQWRDPAVATDSTYPDSYEEVSVPALARALEWVAARPQLFDVVSNHSLHPLPLRAAPRLGIPMVTTLHTPVDPGFVAAQAATRGAGSAFLSVSDHTRREWARAGVASAVLHNGVDPRAWPMGPGGEGLVWFGRIVPEKAPHLAIEAARRTGRPLTIAGRIGDSGYAEAAVLPLLGDDVPYVGALGPRDLAHLVGRSAVMLATPAWAEPFGLVAPEALMCGTPVVGFAVGGVPEIAAQTTGVRLVEAGDVSAMSESIEAVAEQSARDPDLRRRIRASATQRFSLERRVGELERVFSALARTEGRVEELTA